MLVSNGNWIESTVHCLQATKPLFGEQCLKVHVREMVLVTHLNELQCGFPGGDVLPFSQYCGNVLRLRSRRILPRQRLSGEHASTFE